MRIDSNKTLVRPATTGTPSNLYNISPRERRIKRAAASAEQTFLDGQVNCPRKGPLSPQISVVTCESMHARDPAECGRCQCGLHMAAKGKIQELDKSRSTM